MKKCMVKGIALMLVVMMMLSAGACGQKVDNTTTADISSANGTTISQPNSGKGNLPIVDKLETLSILAIASSTTSIGNDIMTFKELEKRTNIHLEWELLPQQAAEEKFNLIMMSGKIPDVVSYNNMTLNNKYAMQGAFVPLEDLIKKHAPNIQKNVLANPPYGIKNIKAELSAGDGHIYNLPLFSDNYVGAIFFIREDWLKNVNQKIPTTTDEFYTVMKAFLNGDPNKNGQPDEIPFSSDSGLSGMRALMSVFGARKAFYVDSKDNTIKFSPIDDKAKHLEAIQYVRKLYEEKLIDQELVSQKRAQYDAKSTGDKIGALYCWSSSGAGAATTALQKLSPEKRFIGMLPPKGPHGDQIKEDPQSRMVPRVMISKDNKKPDITMKWFDYMFSDEGRKLLSWGIEGQTFNMVDGMPKRITFDDPTKNPQKEYNLVFPAITYFNEVKSSFSVETVDAFNLYTKSNVMDNNFPNLPLNEEDQALRAKTESEMNTYITENLSKLLMGVDPLSKFDSYIEGFNKIGIDKLKKAYNDAYKKYLEFNKN